ncbi:MAG: HDOD domain-containing protein [Gammaproteobacteria bacterium]|nr:HDOD domain-containing protein [Gammaproteobacteria bacterium]
MASQQIEIFWHDLVEDIRANRVVLPALPDIALRTRKLLEDRNGTTSQLTRVINADVVLTTRLLRVVNSPLHRAHDQIEDIRSAITRLGNTNVRSVVTSLAMEQLYQNKLASPLKRKFLARNWEHSVHVAAHCYIIADNYTPLNADEAMLAGLVHDIGKLPILEYAEMLPDIAADETALNRLLDVLHTRVGALVLGSWKFPPELIAAAAEHEDLDREPGTDADYTDVVIVANLLSYIGTDHPYTRLDWSAIPAFERLALTPEESIAVINNAREQINEIKQLLVG